MQLDEIRNIISDIDTEMAQLFVKRMDAVREVAEYKAMRGLTIEDRDREKKLIAAKSSLIEDEEIRPLYVSFLQNTMDLSKSLQYRLIHGLKVSCAGEAGTAGYEASSSIFSKENIMPYADFEQAYRAAETGECDLAVLPLENSFNGEIGQVYDLIFSGGLYVNGVYAVGHNGSTTRYAVLSRVGNEPSEAAGDKSETFLIMFTVRDEVGGLAKAINIISAYDYNMRVMRSRPMKDLPWHYYFYAELVGDCSTESAERISRALKAACPVVKIVGHFAENSTEPFATV